MPETLDIPCVGYAVKGDIYHGSADGPLLLSLIGRTSRRTKPHYRALLPRLADELGITSVIFDYSGHGDSPFTLEALRPAQHFLEVVTVFDWMQQQFPNHKTFVIGSSYGGFLATQLTKYRAFDALILRAPAIYPPEDFYTVIGETDAEKTAAFRCDQEALSRHPLLARAGYFQGLVLLVVHGSDMKIPAETVNAYAETFHPTAVVIEGLPHSLDNATEAQVEHYNQVLFDWIKQNS